MTPEKFIRQNEEFDKGLQQGFVTVEVALAAVEMARKERIC